MEMPDVSTRDQQASRGILECVLHTPEAIIAPGKRAPSSLVQFMRARGQWVVVCVVCRVRRTSRAAWTPRMPSYLDTQLVTSICLYVNRDVYTVLQRAGCPCDCPLRLASCSLRCQAVWQ